MCRIKNQSIITYVNNENFVKLKSLFFIGQDGALVVWNVQSGQELRRLQTLEGGGFVTACRFLPRNNNLIICALSSGVLQVWNISTGKFNIDCGAKMLGKTTAVTMNPTGNLLWAANDRGYIESFRIDGTTGKLQVS